MLEKEEKDMIEVHVYLCVRRCMDMSAFMPVFKERYYHMTCCMYESYVVITRNISSIMLFNNIKQNFDMAEYLTLMGNKKYRHVISKI